MKPAAAFLVLLLLFGCTGSTGNPPEGPESSHSAQPAKPSPPPVTTDPGLSSVMEEWKNAGAKVGWYVPKD